MDVLETPAERFEDLADFPYPAQQVEVDGLEMAYVDVGGPADSEETFLCLHGEPTWSYLYRHMIPTLSEVGRVLAPDLIGFGRSAKPERLEDHTFALHAETTQRMLEKLDLEEVTLVCQDWGGILGLLAAAEQPDRFARLVPMNTGLPDATWEMPEVWHRFKAFVERNEDVPVRFLIQEGTATELSEAELAAYEAPFPEPRYKAGARAMPLLVPIEETMDGHDEMQRAQKALASWEKPAFVLFAEDDPITRPARDPMRRLLPTAQDEPDIWIQGAAHFLQEDKGEEIAEHIVDFVQRRPLA